MAQFLAREEHGMWISDHVPYRDKKSATAHAQAYRHELEATLDARVKSRNFERDGSWFLALALRAE